MSAEVSTAVSMDIQPPTDALKPAPVVAYSYPVAAPLVSHGKQLLTALYPKLHGRFVFAFHGFSDDLPLRDAVEGVTHDVEGWLRSLPENFKSSTHALSRPKFGLTFVLRHDATKDALGAEFCRSSATLIDDQFERVKKDIVPNVVEATAPSSAGGADGAPAANAPRVKKAKRDSAAVALALAGESEPRVAPPPAAAEGDVSEKVVELQASNAFLKTCVLELIEKHPDNAKFNEFVASIGKQLFDLTAA